jgi:DNA-binding IclR family transcriptional regulator
MSHDLQVLRALVRIVRAGHTPDIAALALAAGGSHDDVRLALAQLVQAGLVDRTPRRVAPTLAGLCIAVATAATRRRRAKPLRRRLPAARRAAA